MHVSWGINLNNVFWSCQKFHSKHVSHIFIKWCLSCSAANPEWINIIIFINVIQVPFLKLGLTNSELWLLLWLNNIYNFVIYTVVHQKCMLVGGGQGMLMCGPCSWLSDQPLSPAPPVPFAPPGSHFDYS